MLKELQDKLRWSGIALLVSVFFILELVICGQIVSLVVQNTHKNLSNAYQAAETVYFEDNVLNLEKISQVEMQYNVYLFLYDRGKSIVLPYSASEKRLAFQQYADTFVSLYRDNENNGMRNDAFAQEFQWSVGWIQYGSRLQDSGYAAEILAIQPVCEITNGIIFECMLPGICLALTCIILIFLYSAWIKKAFVPAYAAQKAQINFLSLAGHELRTPVTVIRSNAELLMESETYSKACINTILTETIRMDTLVEDLILYSRLETKNIKLHVKLLDASSILLDGYTRFHPLLKANQHKLTLKIPTDETMKIMADESRLIQMIGILLSNANVHTPRGTTVEMGLVRKQTSIEFYVQDDGPGIQNKTEIQSDNGSHLGVGLPIASELAKMQGGTLYAENVKPHGVRFVIQFPVV